MNHASLASKYRPQTFAEVTGQETVKAILSRAAAENRVADRVPGGQMLPVDLPHKELPVPVEAHVAADTAGVYDTE